MRIPVLIATIAATATPALASSDAAWEQFRHEVEEACSALAPSEGETAIEVNPFGSEKYGAALLETTVNGTTERMVCIFDKQTKAAEVTGAFNGPGAEVAPTAPPERKQPQTDRPATKPAVPSGG